jgi:RNA polymerase sigma-70 factor, ECF subfamily
MQSTAADFHTIYDAFRPRILRYLKRLVGPNEAEDLAQTVMLRVSESLPRFRGDAALSTWIYRIATNAALDRLRSASFRDAQRLQRIAGTNGGADNESEDGAILPEPQGPSAETTVIRDEMNACIREFIERLPENHKTVMILAELEGFKNSEIADILGISLDTVKIRLHRARGKLRQEFQAGCTFHRDERNEFACDRKP